MGDTKRIRVEPISARDAKRVIRALHYSGKVDPRSSVHLGVFLDGRCGGAMQLGIPIDKRRAIGVVEGTPWNSMLDLHRLALADWLPRNGESRAIAYMLRWLKKEYPWMQWIQSYADATQCGDGAIYRAAGFHLIGIRRNVSMYRMPDGEVCCKIVFEPGFGPNAGKGSIKARYGKTGSEPSGVFLRRIGAEPIPGFQLRYIYFLDPSARERLTVPILPFSEIDKRGAGMYKGKKRARSIASDVPGDQPGEGGATPTLALQSKKKG